MRLPSCTGLAEYGREYEVPDGADGERRRTGLRDDVSGVVDGRVGEGDAAIQRVRALESDQLELHGFADTARGVGLDPLEGRDRGRGEELYDRA